MNRFQRKCIVASAGLHLLLVLVLFVGPGFLTSRSNPETFTLISVDVPPDFLTDDKVNNPGGAGANTPQTPARPTPPPPRREAAQPPPRAPERVDPPQPEKETASDNFSAEPAPRRHQVKVDLTKVVRKPAAKPSDTDSRNSREVADQIGKTVANMKEGLSSATPINVTPGSGNGQGVGPSYANYRDYVGSKYWDAWIPPQNAAIESAVVMASVTIARDGKVISARITRRSGDAEVDASVERALDRVPVIAPFPAGATEETRTYPIAFDLKTKRQTG